MPEEKRDSTKSSRRLEREEYWKEVEAERGVWAGMDPFETDDEINEVEDEYFDLEQGLNYKADRRKTKKEIMPMDGAGLIKVGLNRKYKQQRRQQKEDG